MRRFTVMFVLFSLIMTFFTAQAWAREPLTMDLTVQAALERALYINAALKTKEQDVQRAEEVNDFTVDKIEYIPSGPVPSSNAERLLISGVQSTINYNMAKRNYTAQEDAVVLSVYQSYNAVLQAQEKVRVAELTVQNKLWLQNIAYVSKRVGTLDNASVIQAETNYAAAVSSLEAARKSLDDEYQKFNQLAGLWPEDRPVLVDTPALEKFEVGDLDAEVRKIVNNSPSVWLAGQNVDLAKLSQRLYDMTDSSRSEPYKVKEIDLTKAEMSASDTKDKLDKQVRTLYYTIKQLEEQYTSAQEAIRMAEETQRVTKVKFDVGMATKTDLLNADLALAQAKQTLLDTASQHQIQVMAFKKPWAVASS